MRRAILVAALAASAAHADPDPRMPLAIVVPAWPETFAELGSTHVHAEWAPPHADERWFRDYLARGRIKRLRSFAPIADGWIAMIARDDPPDEPVLYRTVGDYGLVCFPFGDDDAQRDLARAECLAMRASGDAIVIPFGLEPDGVVLSIGAHLSDAVSVKPAGADAFADPAAAARWHTGSSIVASGPMPGGYWVMLDWPTHFEHTVVVLVRARVGGLDVTCDGESRDPLWAGRALAICRSLRIP